MTRRHARNEPRDTDSDIVTPNELAKALSISGLQFRCWLRARKAAGHPLLARHVKHQPYQFTAEQARTLIAEFRSGDGVYRSLAVSMNRAECPRRHTAPGRTAERESVLTFSKEPGHRVSVLWRGRTVVTLADLLRPGLRAVVVGINPAWVSVMAGHYWQGTTGRRLSQRLLYVGLLPKAHRGFMDDAAYAAGVGFTDVVKRPTRRANELESDELQYGRQELERKLIDVDPPLVIFAFKQAATMLLGPFKGNGFLRECRIGRSEIFVMPGPYEKTSSTRVTLDGLEQWVRRRRRTS